MKEVPCILPAKKVPLPPAKADLCLCLRLRCGRIFIELFPILLNCHCGFVWFRHLTRLGVAAYALISFADFWLWIFFERTRFSVATASSLKKSSTWLALCSHPSEAMTCCKWIDHYISPAHLSSCYSFFFRTSPFFCAAICFPFFKTIFCASCALVYVLLQGLKPLWRRWN